MHIVIIGNLMNIIFALFAIIISPSIASAAETREADHPSRWIYESINSWDANSDAPTRFDKTGIGVGIAVIESGNFNLNHEVFAASDITLIDTASDNRADFVQGRDNQYHANHVSALIAGKLAEPKKYIDIEDILYTCPRDNPQLKKSYAPNCIPDFTFYRGLAPDAKIYAYPRRLEKDDPKLESLLAIFKDISSRTDIRLINLSFKMRVNAAIIEELNRLADRGVIFIHAAGNENENLTNENDAELGAIQYHDGTTPGQLSDRFWRRHIWVGALSCFRSETLQVQFEKWRSSAFFLHPEGRNSNFILAPGSCILSAGKNDYCVRSGSSMAAPLVTAALALALEDGKYFDVDLLIKELLTDVMPFVSPINKSETITWPVLNVKKLLDNASNYGPQPIPYEHFLVPQIPFSASQPSDNPTVWNYKAMHAWDSVRNRPFTFGRSGADVNIAMISNPRFNPEHDALKKAKINIWPVESVREIYKAPQLIPLKVVLDESRDSPVLAEETICARVPVKTKTKGEIVPVTYRKDARYYWHANHHAALIVGTMNEPVEVLRARHRDHLMVHNHKVISSYPDFLPNISFHGGLSPQASLYVYPRSRDSDVQSDTDVMIEILDTIRRSPFITLVNIGSKLTINPRIATLLNSLADAGKIIVQAAGNDGKNLELPENANYRPMAFVDGASINDLSDNFWRHHIWAGSLSCHKNASGELAIERWINSSYYLNDQPSKHNFIFAPGAGVISAGYDKYTVESGTSIATAFVSAALALFIEANPKADAELIIKKLLSNRQSIAFDDDRSYAEFSVLNIETLLN